MIKFRTISHLLQIFVLPELKRRLSDASLDHSKLPFEVKQFRAIQRKLPSGKVNPIVEINDEVQLEAKIKVKHPVKPGQPLTLNDVYPDECYIKPPEFDGKPSAYFLCQCLVYDYHLFFDCEPNLPDFIVEDFEETKIPYPILEFLNVREFSRIVNPTDKLRVLSINNWPPAPGYYPGTFSALHNDPEIINDERILAEVTKSYNRAYWKNRLGF